MAKILFDETIDPEHDVHAICVASNDYNGYPIATLIVMGFPVLTYREFAGKPEVFRLSFAGDDAFNPQQQAVATFYWHIGELPEAAYQSYVEGDIDFSEMMDWAEGHEFLAWQEKIAKALKEVSA